MNATSLALEAMDRLEDLLGDPDPLPVLSPLARPEAPALNGAQAGETGPLKPGPRKPVQTLQLALIGGLALAMALGAATALHRFRLPQASTRASVYRHLTEPGSTPAIREYVARAEAGDVVAMRMLAFCYQEGVDAPVNAFESARWRQRAALASHPGFEETPVVRVAQARP